MFSIRLFFGHSFFQCHFSRKSWTLPFAMTCGIWGSTLFLKPKSFWRVVLFFDPRNQRVEQDRTDGIPFSKRYCTWYPVPKTSIISTVPLFQNRPKPERKKGTHRLPTTIGFRGYISFTYYCNARISRGWFFRVKDANCKCVFSNNLVKLERPHPKGSFLEGIFRGYFRAF